MPAPHNGTECYGLGLNKMLCNHPDGGAERSDELWIKPSLLRTEFKSKALKTTEVCEDVLH